MMYTLFQLEYAVQMTLACLLFIYPVRRSQNNRLLPVVFTIVGILIGLLAGFIPIPSQPRILDIVYWMVLAGIYTPLIRPCIRGGWSQALYITFCALALQHAAFDLSQIFFVDFSPSAYSRYFVGMLVIFSLIYLLAARRIIPRMLLQGSYPVGKWDLLPIVTIILLVQIVSVLLRSPLAELSWIDGTLYRVTETACCLFILREQADQTDKMRLQQEVDGVRAQMEVQSRQYKMTQDNIDIINRKCHDLRHQVHALAAAHGEQKSQYVEEITHALNIYDSAINTGSRPLDIIIMEKNLLCQDRQIQFTCMADGKLLSFMSDEDIYALFGNALDNAIEAVSAVQEAQKRVVAVRVYQQNEFVMIQVYNYYQGTLQFENGLPQTSQTDKTMHGFGVKSIRYTAQTYGGVMSVSAQPEGSSLRMDEGDGKPQAEEGIFTLQVMLPMQAA